MLKTELCDLLGIKYPLLQGGMAWISDGKLAAAVSNAGGLGIIAAGNAPADYVIEQIKVAKELTDKPFGVNVMLLSPCADEVAKAVAKEKIAVVTTGAGNPGQYIEMWKEAGIKVIPVVASVAMAKRMARLDVTALIAEGGESGGHIGDLATISLVPQIVDAVDVPIIAAGGIADGRGYAAALLLGACGVQMGTRFLAAHECSIHPIYKEKVLKATDLSTVVTGRRLGHPVRSLKTPFSRKYAAAEYTQISDDELESMAVGAMRFSVQDGDLEKGCFIAGQVAGMVNKEESAKDIVEDVMTGAEKVLRGASQWVK